MCKEPNSLKFRVELDSLGRVEGLNRLKPNVELDPPAARLKLVVDDDETRVAVEAVGSL